MNTLMVMGYGNSIAMSQILVVVVEILLLVKIGEPLECKRKEIVTNTPVISSNCYRECEYPSKPTVCEYEFNVVLHQTMSAHCGDCPFKKEDCNLEKCVPVDGSSRPLIAVNGSLPGPSIVVCEGDTIRVKVTNNLQSGAGVTMHWHGIHQTNTNWMDGVPRATQCAVARGSSFVYEFIAEPAGTHWWHSHAGYQRASGAFGPLIVRKSRKTEFNSNTYDFDLPEHTMTLTDWADMTSLDIALKVNIPALNPRSQTVTILMNGKGERIEFFDETGQIFKTPRQMFEVEAGKKYKIRLIGAFIAACMTSFHIEKHSMTIISTEGGEIIPYETDYLTIAQGERYDFVLHANAVPSAYCIYASGYGNSSCPSNATFILKYKSSPLNNPTCASYAVVPASQDRDQYMGNRSKGMFSAIDFVSSDPGDQELYRVDLRHYITLRSYAIYKHPKDPGYLNGFLAVDNVIYTPPLLPFVTNEPDDSDICQSTLNKTFYYTCGMKQCVCTNILKIKLGKVVEIVFLNTDEDIIQHPMHMHGGSFRLLGLGSFHTKKMTLDNVIQLDKEGGLLRNSPVKAALKDTVMVPSNGYAILRMKAENPGYWFFHCHTMNHGERGMVIVLQFGEPSEMPKPPLDFPRCEGWEPK
ncbi:laccase-1-like [Anneissia japonica]|uniref:laccase-1-like n=1 Tax=Anneissia japonica TaxID=1529436 RepID=UPI0014257FF3|nr:laccase-1-like [Anneissia japonica]